VKLGNVDYPPLPKYMNTNLFRAWSNNLHWLPITWLMPTLDSMKLEACGPARFIWEVSEVVQARSYESQPLHGHEHII